MEGSYFGEFAVFVSCMKKYAEYDLSFLTSVSQTTALLASIKTACSEFMFCRTIFIESVGSSNYSATSNHVLCLVRMD